MSADGAVAFTSLQRILLLFLYSLKLSVPTVAKSHSHTLILRGNCDLLKVPESAGNANERRMRSAEGIDGTFQRIDVLLLLAPKGDRISLGILVNLL